MGYEFLKKNEEFLETVAMKIAELYSKATNTNYDEDLKNKIYKILKEEN